MVIGAGGTTMLLYRDWMNSVVKMVPGIGWSILEGCCVFCVLVEARIRLSACCDRGDDSHCMERLLERNDYRSVSFRRTDKAGDGMSAKNSTQGKLD